VLVNGLFVYLQLYGMQYSGYQVTYFLVGMFFFQFPFITYTAELHAGPIFGPDPTLPEACPQMVKITKLVLMSSIYNIIVG